MIFVARALGIHSSHVRVVRAVQNSYSFIGSSDM